LIFFQAIRNSARQGAMAGIAIGRSMKSPVIIVTLALVAAILLTASLLVATGTRGQEQPWPTMRAADRMPPAGK
jgi:hypothetical protein